MRGVVDDIRPSSGWKVGFGAKTTWKLLALAGELVNTTWGLTRKYMYPRHDFSIQKNVLGKTVACRFASGLGTFVPQMGTHRRRCRAMIFPYSEIPAGKENNV